VTLIAKRVGCAWNTAKKYIDTYQTITRAYENECESVLDLAEMKVIESLKAGDGPMLRYYLSTKGKRRGYVERQEHTGAEGAPIEVSIGDIREQLIDRINRIAARDEADSAHSGPE